MCSQGTHYVGLDVHLDALASTERLYSGAAFAEQANTVALAEDQVMLSRKVKDWSLESGCAVVKCALCQKPANCLWELG